jgi:predicted nucleic acid-binding protein
VTLVDTGPLVALFDPKDSLHERCKRTLRRLRSPFATTVPVLTETFHILSPNSIGSDRLRDFVADGGMRVWYFDDLHVSHAFELMEKYADHPMDLADASVIVAAENVRTQRVFTIDRRDFVTYRIRRGHRHYPVEIVT